MSEFQNKKIQDWRKILDSEQYNIMREAGTESPGSSILNDEKREGTYHCAACDTPLFDSKKNMKVEVVGHLFLRVNIKLLILQQIIILDMLEQNIIVENVEVIMGTYLMTVHSRRVKDIVIMEKH